MYFGALCVPGTDLGRASVAGSLRQQPAHFPDLLWLELVFTPGGPFRLTSELSYQSGSMQPHFLGILFYASSGHGLSCLEVSPARPLPAQAPGPGGLGKAGGVESRLWSHTDLGLNPSCPTDSLL